MADANEDVDKNVDGSDDQNQNNAANTANHDVPDLELTVKELTEKLTKANEILEKARKSEKYAKLSKADMEKQLEEAMQFKARAEQAEAKLRDFAINSELGKVVNEFAKDESAAKLMQKLIDRTKIKINDGMADAESIREAVLALKGDHEELLFKKTELPDTRRTTEGQPISGYEAELAKATTLDEVLAVGRKYGLNK